MTLESGTLTSADANSVVYAGNQNSMVSSVIINGGTVKAALDKYSIGLSTNAALTISGGEITGHIMVGGGSNDPLLKPNTIKISGGTISGDFTARTGASYEMKVTGGTFTDESFTKYIPDDAKIIEENGKFTVVSEAVPETVTKNIGTATGADATTATGFITTITGGGEFKLNTIQWSVTSDNTTKESEKYVFEKDITAGGTVLVGLVVDGLYDGNATANAVVNK